jgi:ABC-type lipoprotein release transport system permease subunit
VSLLRYALSSIARSRKRTFSSILGVTLAIVLISGTFIAVDSSTWATLNAMLRDVAGDFWAGTYPSNRTVNASDLRQAFLSVSGVLDVSIYRPLPTQFPTQGLRFGNASGGYTGWVAAYGIEPDHLPSYLRGVPVNGSLELPRSSVALSTTLARGLRVGIGDLFYVSNAVWDPTVNATRIFRVNFTVAALLTTPASGFPIGFCVGFCGGPSSLVVVNLRDLDWLDDSLDLTDQFATSDYAQVWVDRVRFVNPYDIDGSKRALLRLGRDLQAAYPVFGNVGDNVSPVLDSFAQTTSLERLIFLLLSTPVLLLGLYLGAVGVELAHGDRRREMAILKTRGSSGRQVFGLLLTEAALGGLIAAALGLLAGALLSRLLVDIVNPFANLAAVGSGSVVLSLGTAVTVALLSVLFMAAASYRSARRTAELPIVETLRYYAPGETQIRYRPIIDVALVTLGTVTFAFAWLTQFQPGSFLTFLVGGVFFALLPAAPIFLILGATRLATRSTGRVYDWAARASKLFAKDLHHVIRRNLSRNPRRSANVAVIVALGLGFGLFAYGLMGSQQAYQARTARAVVGGDIAIFRAPDTPGLLQNLSALPDVAAVVRFTGVAGTTSFGWPLVYALDPSSYFDVIRAESWYFEGLSPPEAKAILETKGGLLATERYLRDQALEIGQVVGFSLTTYNGTTGKEQNVHAEGTIRGVVRVLPGMSNGETAAPEAIYGGYVTFQSIVDNQTANYPGGDNYILNLRPGADWRTAETDVSSLVSNPANAVEPTVLAMEELNLQQAASPVTQAFLGFIRIEIVFLASILTAGLGLVLVAASLEREPEFAAIAARGASRRQTSGLLVGEGFAIVLIGIAVGAGIGILASYLGMEFFLVGPPGTPPTLVPFFFVMPPEGWLLLVLAPVAMLIESLLVGWRIARMNVARVLKLRGG